MPVSVKDILLTEGWPTLRGSHSIDPDQLWDVDAPAVARLREHNAVIVGKTTTPELGWKGVTDSPLTGVTRNPWDTTKTAGGSSGGASAAVAAGMGTISLGTDGGGSIRIPASFSGVFGIKPTYGLVPIYPASPFGTLAHVGPLSWSVADSALALDVITGADSRDWTAGPRPDRPFAAAAESGVTAGIAGMRIAFSPTLGHVEVDREVAAIVEAAVDVFAELGAVVSIADPGFADPVAAFHALWFSGAAASTAALTDEQRARLDPGLREVCEQGAAVLGAGLSRRDRAARRDGPDHGRVPRALRPAADADDADRRVRGGGGGAAGVGRDALDRVDAVHLPVQHDAAARRERAVRVHVGGACRWGCRWWGRGTPTRGCWPRVRRSSRSGRGSRTARERRHPGERVPVPYSRVGIVTLLPSR